MTARKPKAKAEPIEPSHEAEHEQDTVGEAKPAERVSARDIAIQIASEFQGNAKVDGNRLTFTLPGPNGLVQTFHATVEPGITEF